MSRAGESEDAAVRRVSFECLAGDEQQMKVSPEDTYLISYREFLAFFANLQTITRHDLVVGANMVYGWMPRILTFHGSDMEAAFADAVRILNRARGQSPVTSAEIGRLKGLIDNSVVATSKLLHFVNPNVYAIWDSRVCKYIHGTAYQVGSIECYCEYLDICRQLVAHLGFPALHASINSKIGYDVSSYRAVEIVMYSAAR